MSVNHVRQEKETIAKMIKIYCHAKHGTKGNELCDSCKQLKEYTQIKTNKCVFGNMKPACSVCPVHCYTKVYREKIKEVMRFAGMLMLFMYPKSAFLHFMNVHRTKKILKNKKVSEIILKLKRQR